MNMEKNTVKMIENLETDVKEQIVEADIILPEYYEEISKILKIDIVPTEETVTVTEGKYSLAGCAAIKLIYLTESGNISVFEQESKYTKVFNCKDVEASDCIIINQDVNSVNYRATGPKRVEIKADISISGCIKRIVGIECISNVNDNIEYDAAECDIYEPVSCIIKNAEFNETVNEIKLNAENIKVIKCESEMFISETKAIKNKLMVKGSVKIRAYYIAKDNKSDVFDYSFPFTDVFEMFGIEDSSITEIIPLQIFSNVRFTDNDHSGNVADMNVKVKFMIKGYNPINIKIINDCYSLSNEINAEYSVLKTEINNKADTFNKTVNAEVELYDDNIDKIIFAYCDNVTLLNTINSHHSDGTLELNAVLSDKNNNISFLNRKISFSVDSENDGYVYSVLPCMNVSAKISSPGKIQFNINLNVNCEIKESNKMTVITNMEAGEKDVDLSADRITLYFAEKGEKVWNIAKNNKTTVKSICENNNLEGTVNEDNMMLIFSDL